MYLLMWAVGEAEGGEKKTWFVFYCRLFDQQIVLLNGVINPQYKKINQYDKLVYGTDKEKKQRKWLEKTYESKFILKVLPNQFES